MRAATRPSHAAMRHMGDYRETFEVGIMPDLEGLLRRLAFARARLLELLGREIPVEKLADHGLHELGAAIFVVDVVRVLPDVERQERSRPHGERIAGVRSGKDLELV